MGKLPQAVAEYERVVTICDRLRVDTPKGESVLAVVRRNLGAVYVDMREYAKAEPHLRAAEAVFAAAAKAAPGDPESTADLAGMHFQLGEWLAYQGKYEAAVKEYTTAIAHQEKVPALRKLPPDKSIPKDWINLSLFRNGLGRVLAALGRYAEAERVYRQVIVDREMLARDFPSVVSYQLDLGGGCCNLGLMLYHQGQAEKSLKWLDSAVRTLTPLFAQAPNEVMVREFLGNSYFARAHSRQAVGRCADAVADWDKVIEMTPKAKQLRARLFREVARAGTPDTAKAVEATVALTKAEKLNGDHWYDVTRMYAVASTNQADKREEYARAAVEAFGKSVAAGVDHRDHVCWEKDLDPLRERDDFKKLVADLEAKFPPKEVLPPPREDK